MNRRKSISTIRKSYFDPANWLQNAPMQAAVSVAAPLPVSAKINSGNSILPRDNTTAPRTHALAQTAKLKVTSTDWRGISKHLDAWNNLIERCIERNIFLEPAFALSAAQHSIPAQQPVFVNISEVAGEDQDEKLLGLFAFEPFGRTTSMVAKFWQSPQMTMSGPLIDAGRAIEVLDALQDWLATNHPMISGLSLSSMNTQGPLAALLHNHARMRGLQTRVMYQRTRAVIDNSPDASDRVKNTIGSKRAKELRRLTRKLQAKGELSFVTYSEPSSVQAAMEQFLGLEAGGWKGQRGTAFLNDPSLTLFARTLVRRLAIHDSIEIDALILNGETVAMAIVLRNGSKAHYWKTSYNEKYAAYSPGVLLTWKLADRLLADASVTQVDSCATPNHNMADHMFPDRVELADMMISSRGCSEQAFRIAASIEETRRNLRVSAKRAYHGLRALRS